MSTKMPEVLSPDLFGKDCNAPLTTKFVNGALVMTVGIGTIKWCAENHPEFWNGDTDKYALKINDPEKFAKAVELEFNDRELEDGSTVLTRTLDKCIVDAVGDGCDGYDFNHFRKIMKI